MGSTLKTVYRQAKVGEAWRRIEAWLSMHAAHLAAGFNPPATRRELVETEKFLGVKLPEDVRFSYLRHDGHSGELFFGWEWYSLEQMRHSWKFWMDLLAERKRRSSRNDTGSSRVRTDWWHPAWIPITHCDTGDEHAVDLAPGPGGTPGQIIETLDRERFVVATSLTGFLTGFADDLEAGWLTLCRETGVLDRIEWLWATLTRDAEQRKQEAWHVILRLGRQFGWAPAGTRPPRGVRVGKWDAGDYTTRVGQQVTAEDASALATALDKALAAIPKGDAAKSKKGASRELAFFTGYARRDLGDFIKYCRRGAFRITDDPTDE